MSIVDNAVKQKIISDYIKTPQGRSKLAASMTQPLRLRRDYTSVGRKTFLVEQLPDGALPIYDKDPDVTAFVVGEEGENILAITKPRKLAHISNWHWISLPISLPLCLINDSTNSIGIISVCNAIHHDMCNRYFTSNRLITCFEVNIFCHTDNFTIFIECISFLREGASQKT